MFAKSGVCNSEHSARCSDKSNLSRLLRNWDAANLCRPCRPITCIFNSIKLTRETRSLGAGLTILVWWGFQIETFLSTFPTRNRNLPPAASVVQGTSQLPVILAVEEIECPPQANSILLRLSYNAQAGLFSCGSKDLPGFQISTLSSLAPGPP
jgi:hypothetical protein